jgi:hypothetical protein
MREKSKMRERKDFFSLIKKMWFVFNEHEVLIYLGAFFSRKYPIKVKNRVGIPRVFSFIFMSHLLLLFLDSDSSLNRKDSSLLEKGPCKDS